MIKKVFLSLIISLFLSINVAYAANCDALFQDPADLEFIREILGYVTILVPILLVVLCSTDLVAIITSQDDGISKKAGGRIAKRFIAASAFFFVPLIVRFVLGLEPVKNSLNLVDDPTCGITTDSNQSSDDANADQNGGT